MINLLIRRLIVLSIFLSALWFGFKFYSESQISEKLNQLAFIASSQAIIRFEDVTVHITGKISISNIEITPVSISEDPFHAEKISLIFPNTFEMIKLMYNVGMGNDVEMPESLRLQLDGINDPFIDDQSIYAGITEERNSFLREELKNTSEPICGDDYIIGPDDYKEMGISSLITGFYWEYKYNKDNQKLMASFGFSATDLYTASMKINIANQQSVGIQDLMQMPQISSVEMVYQDQGLVPTTNKYCAQKSGISLDEFIQRNTYLPDEYYLHTIGIIPNEAMKKAYIDFLRKPESISITSYLPPNFNPMILAVYDTEHWVSTLGLSLKVNNNVVSPFELITPDPSEFMVDQSAGFEMAQDGWDDIETIEDLSMDTEPQIEMDWESESANEQGTTSSAFMDEQPVEEHETAFLHRQPRSRDIPVYQLSDHIGRQVEVFVERSKSFSGELLAVDREALILQVRVGGGTITMPIRIQRIKSVESR